MAYNPLQQKMADQGQIPASHGISTSQATDSIAALLDENGLDAGHARHELGEGETETQLDARRARGQDSDQLDEGQADQSFDEDEDTSDGDTAETEGAAGDDEEDAEQKGQDDRAEDEGEADTAPIESLAEMAEAMEMTPDELLTSLTHTFKAAGQEHTVTLQDLVSGYQLRADYDRDKTAMAESRRNFEAEQAQKVQQYEQNANVLSQQHQVLVNTLAGQLQSAQMLELQRDDPTAYLIKRQEIETQLTQLQGVGQAAAQHYNEVMAQQRADFIKAEGMKLQNEVEGWGQEKLDDAVSVIKSLGFSDAEVDQNPDSRFIKGALELKTLRDKVATLEARIAKGDKAATTVKRTVPKGLKPGKTATPNRRGVDRSAVSKLRRAHGQTKSVKSAASLIEQLI